MSLEGRPLGHTSVDAGMWIKNSYLLFLEVPVSWGWGIVHTSSQWAWFCINPTLLVSKRAVNAVCTQLVTMEAGLKSLLPSHLAKAKLSPSLLTQ